MHSLLIVSGKSKECGGLYTGQSGSISSPGYPETNYRNNLYCQYTIKSDQALGIQLEFKAFDVEGGYDFLEVS